MRILFECSKTRYKFIRGFLQVLENFAKSCFIQRSLWGQFHQHFKDYKYGTIVLCDSKIGKCSNQAFLSILIITSSQKEKEGKVQHQKFEFKLSFMSWILQDCYKFAFKLRFVTKSNAKSYNSKSYKFLKVP